MTELEMTTDVETDEFTDELADEAIDREETRYSSFSRCGCANSCR
jgi:hypothetical protein